MIRVQREDFDIAAEIERLKAGNTDIGAIVTFTGTMRDSAHGQSLTAMTLEHYPGMTETELTRIEAEANARWPLQASLIVHRFGTLKPGDNIVLVVTASEHREAAFRAAEFLMDYLKTSAPFWKCETGPGGNRWVEAERGDGIAHRRWDKTKPAADIAGALRRRRHGAALRPAAARRQRRDFADDPLPRRGGAATARRAAQGRWQPV